ncbi:pPIWI_RE_Y domain-containing protein [Streptomonospora sediminis]
MSSTPGIQRRDDDAALRVIATGLISTYRGVAKGAPLSVPYAPDLQRGLDLLTVICMRDGARPPAGIPELLQWCHEPLGSWRPPVGGPDVATDQLLEAGSPTRSCQEWAVEAAQGGAEAELFENEVIAAVRSACRNAGRPDAYKAFRRLVIDQPVLTEKAYQLELTRPELQLIKEPLGACYPPAPVEFVDDSEVKTCASCKNLLLPAAEGLLCLDERCPRTGAPAVGTRLNAEEGIRWLAGPIRTFIASPGRPELRLYHKIERAGASVELWPDFDAYDLRIVFPDEEAWAVDVKDWSNPVRLARCLKPIPLEPPWRRSYIVPAKEAVAAVPGYVQTLRQRAKPMLREHQMIVASERQMLAYVTKKLESLDA